MVARFVCFGVAWFAGILAGAWLLAPVIIILMFGIPFTYEMKRKGVLTSTAPAKRYVVSFVLLLGLFGLVSWSMWYLFPEYLWGYIVGVALTVLPNFRKCGRTEANVTEFLETNGEYVDQEALARYLAR